jgi:ABC-type glycerol-3-phosphate transport system substrate-binding protein
MIPLKSSNSADRPASLRSDSHPEADDAPWLKVKKHLFIANITKNVSLFAFSAASLIAGIGLTTTSAFGADKPFDGTEVRALVFRSLDGDYIASTLAPRLKSETGITLTVDQVPYEEVRAKQLADRAGAKRYDILNTTTEWSYEYRKFAAPLNAYIGNAGYPDIEQTDIIPFVWKAFNPGQKIAWMPYQPDTRIFFYRGDLLQAAGIEPPKTWDELLAAAKALTKPAADGKDAQYGFIFPGQRGWNLTLAWIPFVYAAGGDIFKDGKPAFDSQAGVDALNLLIELKKYAPPDVISFGEHEVNQSVLHGQVAMGVSASAITPEIEGPDSPIKSKVTSSGFPLQTADTKPKHSAALGGWAFGVSEYTKQKDAAAYVAMWLASRPIVTEMQTHGRQHAARLSMAKDPGLLAVNPHIPAIVQVLTNAEIFFPGSQGAAIGELLNVRVAQAVAGEMKPKEALDAAVSDIDNYLSSHPG